LNADPTIGVLSGDQVIASWVRRTAEIGNPGAMISAMRDTTVDTVVGKVDWKTSQIKNVAKTPLVGGQWRLSKGGKYKYDLVITSNATAPNIPVAGEMQPIT